MKRRTSRMAGGLLLIGLTLASLPRLAGAEIPVVDSRELKQERRIERGVRSGQLTHREAVRLQRQQARIRAEEGRLKADGRRSRRERARLQGMQDHANADINRLKHNDRATR